LDAAVNLCGSTESPWTLKVRRGDRIRLRLIAKFAQEWADEVARTGKLLHRPREGPWKQDYGENMAWGTGRA
jgi:hypothetical protein